MKPVKLSAAQSHASSRQAELHHGWPLVQHIQAANATHVQQATLYLTVELSQALSTLSH